MKDYFTYPVWNGDLTGCGLGIAETILVIEGLLMMILIYYALAFAAIGLFIFFITRPMRQASNAVHKRAKQVMANRRSLNPEEFSSQYFPPEQAEIAARLHKILSTILIVDASRIHHEDQLFEDLGLGQVDGMDPNWLELDISDEFGVEIEPAWSSIRTMRDLVEYVAARIAHENHT